MGFEKWLKICIFCSIFIHCLPVQTVFLNESCAGIAQRSLDETLSVSYVLPLEIYARSRTVAIIKQLQFHMACSFEIEEEKGGGKSSVVKRSKCANIDVPFSKAPVVQLSMYYPCLTTKTSHFLLNWKINGKENDQLHNRHWWFLVVFILKRQKALLDLCSHALSLTSGPTVLPWWTLGTRVFSLQDNDREEAVSMTLDQPATVTSTPHTLGLH